jgi:hypothetical protein
LAFPLAIWWARGQKLFAAGDAEIEKKLVKESDPMPAALRYHRDATKVEVGMRKSNDMVCRNCVQYTKKATYKNAEVGTCTLFQMGYVTSGGWCMSWSKKS